MATLHERLIGAGLPEQQTSDEAKINIHAFIGALLEFSRGEVTGQDVVGFFNLTANQTAQAQTLVGLVNAAPNKTLFMRVFKDWVYLGEAAVDARYLSTSNLVTRLQSEVTDQGGTLP